VYCPVFVLAVITAILDEVAGIACLEMSVLIFSDAAGRAADDDFVLLVIFI
jgi:hypothetical protein